jgi:hypothetical protein
VLHPLFVVAICFFPDRTLRGDVSNDKFFGVLRQSFQASPFLSTHLILLLSLALYSSLVSRCFCLSHVSYPPVIQSKAIEPSIHPINRVLVVELALRVVGMFRLFRVVLSYWVGKLSHALLYGYMLLEIFMAYFIVNT